jgi:uncharacterized protein YndB with AHSA1/START domain
MTIKKSIHVRRPVDAAFRLFVDQIGTWWPLKQGFSFGGARADRFYIEGRRGGRVFERYTDGEEFDLGVVTEYAPPSRIVFTWKSPDWDGPTEVEVRFAADGDGTRLELEHRGWERAGEAAGKVAPRYSGGWDTILARYAAA